MSNDYRVNGISNIEKPLTFSKSFKTNKNKLSDLKRMAEKPFFITYDNFSLNYTMYLGILTVASNMMITVLGQYFINLSEYAIPDQFKQPHSTRRDLIFEHIFMNN